MLSVLLPSHISLGRNMQCHKPFLEANIQSCGYFSLSFSWTEHAKPKYFTGHIHAIQWRYFCWSLNKSILPILVLLQFSLDQKMLVLNFLLWSMYSAQESAGQVNCILASVFTGLRDTALWNGVFAGSYSRCHINLMQQYAVYSWPPLRGAPWILNVITWWLEV